MRFPRPVLAAMLLASMPALAQTTSTSMTVKDGAGTTRQLRADQNGDGSLATHSVPEVGGASVSNTNPLPTQDANGGAAGSGISQPTGGSGVLGWLSGIYQKLSGTLTTKPASYTLVPLDVSTVTTGGTAVTALTAGHRTAGGWIQNPPSATINLCINEQGTASGTTSSGNTTCIVPGQTYTLTPTTGAVSVISSDNSHAFSGQGYQ